MATSTVVDVDVVIVGGGTAGLCAARTLSAAGRVVVVLEARGRVGGRLLSPSISGDPVDLGATWFWPNEPRVQSLIAELGVQTHPQYLAGDGMYHDYNGAQRIQGNPIDVPSGRFTQGSQAVTDALASTVPGGAIRLDHPVTRVTLEDDQIAGHASAVCFAGDHLIMAIPPALAVSSITFSPGLDPRTVQVARSTPVWMGGITKVVARYRSPFWRERGLAGACMSHSGPMREIHDLSGPGGVPAQLFGFVPPTRMGGPTVSKVEVVDQLVEVFGPEAGDPSHVLIHDWRRERHTSPPGVEGLQGHELFGHPRYLTPELGGRMHWASTETSREFAGHIEGAIAAADRAVAAIDAAMAGDPS